MFDETELNPQLREGEAAIEAALRGVMLPDSAIDHDRVMYQAGWAAAMAEHGMAEHGMAGQQPNATATLQTKRTAGYWPALAMTFAATTAACLMVILLPPAESGSVAANTKESNRPEAVVKIDHANDDNANDVAKAPQTKTKLTAFTGYRRSWIKSKSLTALEKQLRFMW